MMLVEPVDPRDATEVSAYLARAMQPPRPERYWMRLFRPDSGRPAGPHGFKLTGDAGGVVGFIGTIRTGIPQGDGTFLRLVNLSTFVVDEAYRALAPFLLKRALGHEADVVTDLTANEEVFEILKRLKFQPLGAGRYFAPTPAFASPIRLAGGVRREADFGAAHRRLFPDLPLPLGLERLSFETLCVADRGLVAWAPRTKFGLRFAEILYVRQGPEPIDDLLGRIATHLLARRGALLLRYDPAIHGLPTGRFIRRHRPRTHPLVLGKVSQSVWFYLCSELSILNDYYNKGD
ncbi:MAG TPA: hypothetical protein VHG30_04270 [Microvirga sp.]|nr:hypothetical protein [Microvirga sp.]